MPELPEVEFARNCLSRWLRGKKLARVSADRTRVIRGSSPQAFTRLAGRQVTKVERRGKWLVLRFDADTALLAHLGMTGKFELASKGDPPLRWSRVRLTRADGAVVHYRDPRKFGRLQVAPLSQLLASEPLASLGPDAYTEMPPPTALAARFGKSRRKVKEVLMDQTVLAGLGNIQATDILFLARIHPARRADSLTPAEVARIVKAIRASLERTIAMNRGDKITYVEESTPLPDGKTRGRVENPFLVYGKAKLPCPRCGTLLKKTVIGGRTSAFCPSCQKRAK